MKPGKPQILTCPFCGKKKKIMSLASGNNFGSELWSDNKQIAPMLPEISYIQKCPSCRKYYIKGRQAVRFSNWAWAYSFETGVLTYHELKEAFEQLSEEGFMNVEEEGRVRLMLHHAYNDYYFRNEDRKEVPERDKQMFHDNALWLINNYLKNNVMKAEFYREIGDMEAAEEILDSTMVEDNFLKKIVSSIRERVAINKCEVFRIR